MIRLVGRGYSRREIAERRGVAEATVRTQIESVMGKLGIMNADEFRRACMEIYIDQRVERSVARFQAAPASE